MVALVEIEGSHGITIDVNTLGAEIQLVIKTVNARQLTNIITDNSSSKYTHLLIKQVNDK